LGVSSNRWFIINMGYGISKLQMYAYSDGSPIVTASLRRLSAAQILPSASICIGHLQRKLGACGALSNLMSQSL